MRAGVWGEEPIFTSSSLKLRQQVDRGEERVSGRRGRSIWAVGLHLGAKGWRWAPAQAAGSVGVIDCVCPQGWPPADTELLHGLNYSFLGSTTSRWLERRGLNSYFV